MMVVMGIVARSHTWQSPATYGSYLKTNFKEGPHRKRCSKYPRAFWHNVVQDCQDIAAPKRLKLPD